MRLNFRVEGEAAGSRARAGRLRTLHNEVETPIFMPVGTKAIVRHQKKDQLWDAGAQILLANTYHLLLRPGAEVFEAFGGIHAFMKWPRSVLTDSGGFQIFSLPNKRQMSEAGARFRSYVDGQHVLLSPERSIAMQKSIGSDIMMVLDECVPSTCEKTEARRAMELTHRWALRSLAARGESPQALFGIIQGACFADLRRESAEFLTTQPFDGFAIGGLAVGESKAQREDFTELTTEWMPKDLPRYLMGVGTPIDLLEAVHRGVDMFDCILPTAMAEQGIVYTAQGRLQIKRGVYKFSQEVIDKNCPCPTCQEYSRAYLHHLIKSGEPTGAQLLSTHNLYFYQLLMREMRATILQGNFLNYYQSKRQVLAQEDAENPIQAPKIRRRKERPRTLGAYEIVEGPGRASLRHVASGEIMHPGPDPDREAHELYVEQSGLLAKLQKKDLILWDVGLGAAHNAMAAIQAIEKLGLDEIKHGLRIFSFENDLNSLRLATQRPELFPHVRGSGPQAILENSFWRSRRAPIEWTLLAGDFFAQFRQAPPPDIVFYDPFSSKTNEDFWNLEAFTTLYQFFQGRNVELFTYSASTRVRARLLSAGFYVAAGQATGAKTETTIAHCTHEGAATSLLGSEWLSRWQRSDAREAPLEERLLRHPQFSLC